MRVVKESDYIGRTFGRLTVICRIPAPIGGYPKWKCNCSCGNETSVFTGQLNNGNKTSCGCLKKDTLRAIRKTHGMSDSKTFRSWCHMRRRCTDINNPKFHLYGGRGITVCDRWMESFANFLEDMGVAPKNMSLDRIDVDGNYEPSNCRWATQKQQTRNMLRTIRITVNGIEISLIEYCEIHGLSYSKLKDRIRKFGWSVERAISTP